MRPRASQGTRGAAEGFRVTLSDCDFFVEGEPHLFYLAPPVRELYLHRMLSVIFDGVHVRHMAREGL